MPSNGNWPWYSANNYRFNTICINVVRDCVLLVQHRFVHGKVMLSVSCVTQEADLR